MNSKIIIKTFVFIIIVSFLVLPVMTAVTANSGNAGKRPLSAVDVHLAKKILVSSAAEKAKGKPAGSPGQDNGKNKDSLKRAATGVLGDKNIANKYAVVIGICDYPGTTNDICLSDGDSYNMRKVLVEKYGYESDNIYWFRDAGGAIEGISYGVPTRENILGAIAAIKGKAGSNDEVVFFFSGHGANGIADDEDAEYVDEAIVVHNDDSSDLAYIWDGELRDIFSGFAAMRIVFAFDSCLAGGMNDVAADGRVVITATGETQSAYVYSGGEFGEGVFSRLFVNKGMLQGWADGYNQLNVTDNNVAVEESFDYAKENLPSYLKSRQKPIISDSFANDLLL